MFWALRDDGQGRWSDEGGFPTQRHFFLPSRHAVGRLPGCILYFDLLQFMFVVITLVCWWRTLFIASLPFFVSKVL